MHKKWIIASMLAMFILIFIACTNHEVDTFPEWCEQISGIDLEEKYGRPYAPFFSVSFHGEAIRDDFTRFLNDTYVEKTDGRASEMVWRTGTVLHMINLSSLFVIESEEFISAWENGIELSKTYSHTNPADTCLYGTLTSLFDILNIHTYTFDALGNVASEEVKTIHTERRARLGDNVL